MYHCTREERFGHVSNRSLDKCDILKEKEKIKVTIAARCGRGPSSSSRGSIFHISRDSSSFLCFVLDHLCWSSSQSEQGMFLSTMVLLSNDYMMGACKCDGHFETRETQQEAACFESGEQ
jgi:hypothetical protein